MSIIDRLGMLYWINFFDKYARDNKKVDITLKFKVKKRLRNNNFKKNIFDNNWWRYTML